MRKSIGCEYFYSYFLRFSAFFSIFLRLIALSYIFGSFKLFAPSNSFILPQIPVEEKHPSHDRCLSKGECSHYSTGYTYSRKRRIRNRTGTQGATLSTCRWWDAPHVPVSRHSPVLFLVRSIKGNFLTSPHWHHQPLATPPRDVSHVPSLGHCFQLALHRTLAGLAMYLSLPASPADIGEDFFHRFSLRRVHLTFAFYI